MEVMARVCRARTVLSFAQHQAVGAKDIVETVPSNLELIAKVFLAQGKQLTAAALRQPILSP